MTTTRTHCVFCRQFVAPTDQGTHLRSHYPDMNPAAVAQLEALDEARRDAFAAYMDYATRETP